jgi:hypothetical protein
VFAAFLPNTGWLSCDTSSDLNVVMCVAGAPRSAAKTMVLRRSGPDCGSWCS